jgi:threonine dehydratase
VCIISGGNNDLSRYAEIQERSMVHRGRKHYFVINFAQKPGSLRRYVSEVLGPTDDITHFEYVKKNNRAMGPALVGIELADHTHLPRLIERMHKSEIQFEHLEGSSPLFGLVV